MADYSKIATVVSNDSEFMDALKKWTANAEKKLSNISKTYYAYDGGNDRYVRGYLMDDLGGRRVMFFVAIADGVRWDRGDVYPVGNGWAKPDLTFQPASNIFTDSEATGMNSKGLIRNKTLALTDDERAEAAAAATTETVTIVINEDDTEDTTAEETTAEETTDTTADDTTAEETTEETTEETEADETEADETEAESDEDSDTETTADDAEVDSDEESEDDDTTTTGE